MISLIFFIIKLFNIQYLFHHRLKHFGNHLSVPYSWRVLLGYYAFKNLNITNKQTIFLNNVTWIEGDETLAWWYSTINCRKQNTTKLSTIDGDGEKDTWTNCFAIFDFVSCRLWNVTFLLQLDILTVFDAFMCMLIFMLENFV